MPVEVSEGSTHVIKVDSDVPESGLDVLVSVQFGYGLDGGSGMVEVASEGPSQSMVLEIQSDAVTDLVYDTTINAVPPFRVRTASGLVHVVAPDQQVVGRDPSRIVGSDTGDHLGACLQPSSENLLTFRVERNGPPLTFTTTLSTDRDGLLARIFVKMDVTYTELYDFGYAESHTEFEMDDNILKRGLVTFHQSYAFFIGEPIDIGTVIVTEFDLHSLDYVVLVELQIPVHYVEVPVASRDRLIRPVFQEESDDILIDVAGIHLQSVVPEDIVDVVEDSEVLVRCFLLGPPIGCFDVFVDTGRGGIRFADHGTTQMNPAAS